jgi:protein TonB
MASAGGPRFQPRWLRPLALVLVVCVHAAGLAALRPHFEETPLPSIIVDLVPAPSPPEPPPAPVEPTPQETPLEMPQETVPPVAETPPPEPEMQTAEAAPQPPQPELPQPEPPKVVAPEALPLPVAKPRSPVTPKKIVERREPKPLPKPIPKPKPVAAPKPAAPKPVARAARPTSAPAAASVARPSGNTGMSVANYGSIVISALKRLQVYPPSAREAGITGSVGISFTIGTSGRVTRSSIRSSGHGMLDAAARQMLASLHVPPPPGGMFSGSTTISFSLR